MIEHTAVVHVAGRHHVPHGFRTAADIDADVRDQSRLLEYLVEVVVVGMRVLVHSALAVVREIGDRVVQDRQTVVGTRLIVQHGVLVRIQHIGLVGEFLPPDVDVHVDRRLSDKTALGRYQQDSVGSLLSVQSDRSRVLQNRDAFDLIQGKLVVLRPETIDDHQRRIRATVGIESPDVDARFVSSRLVRAFFNDQTGQTADQGLAYRRSRRLSQLVGMDRAHRRSHCVVFLLAVSHVHHPFGCAKRVSQSRNLCESSRFRSFGLDGRRGHKQDQERCKATFHLVIYMFFHIVVSI